MKANPHPRVVQEIVDAGIRQFDVASRFEIELVNSISHTLHFNHPVKPPEEIEFAYFQGKLRNFVVDCVEELDKITEVLRAQGKQSFEDVTLLVRFHDPGYSGTEHYHFGSKFGAAPGEAVSLLKQGDLRGFRMGIAFHPGSQTCNPDIYGILMRKAHEIAVRGMGERISNLARNNVGGGFPCRYGGHEPHLAEFFKVIREQAGLFACEIQCEPGRALVAESLHLVARIVLRRQGERKLYLNDGMYGSFLEFAFVNFMPPVRAYRADGTLIDSAATGEEEFEIWGPTCDSLDRLRYPVRLPSSISMGDYLEFGLMGAYTNATQTRFNGIQAAELLPVGRLERWWTESW
jgi:ornithine decarboxylase